MLSVTESALNHLSGILVEGEPDRALRLTSTEEGLALVPDSPKSGDQIHEQGGKPVLVVDERVSTAIGDQTLDVAVVEGKTKLTLRQPPRSRHA